MTRLDVDKLFYQPKLVAGRYQYARVRIENENHLSNMNILPTKREKVNI